MSTPSFLSLHINTSHFRKKSMYAHTSSGYIKGTIYTVECRVKTLTTSTGQFIPVSSLDSYTPCIPMPEAGTSGSYGSRRAQFLLTDAL